MRASLAAVGAIATGLALASVRDTVIPTLLVLLVLVVAPVALVKLVARGGRTAGEKPVYPGPYSGIGSVGGVYPVNTGYRSEHVHAMVHNVDGLPHNDSAAVGVTAQQGVWAVDPVTVAEPASGGHGQAVSAADAHQRRQPSSVARRALTHRRQR